MKKLPLFLPTLLFFFAFSSAQAQSSEALSSLRSYLKANVLRLYVDGDGMQVENITLIDPSDGMLGIDPKFRFALVFQCKYIIASGYPEMKLVPHNIHQNSIAIERSILDDSKGLWVYKVKFTGTGCFVDYSEKHYMGELILNTKDRSIADKIVSLIKQVASEFVPIDDDLPPTITDANGNVTREFIAWQIRSRKRQIERDEKNPNALRRWFLNHDFVCLKFSSRKYDISTKAYSAWTPWENRDSTKIHIQNTFSTIRRYFLDTTGSFDVNINDASADVFVKSNVYIVTNSEEEYKIEDKRDQKWHLTVYKPKDLHLKPYSTGYVLDLVFEYSNEAIYNYRIKEVPRAKVDDSRLNPNN